MSAGGGEFVEGWLVAQLLGEGAYGEVRLLVHAHSGAAVALKVVRGGGAGGGAAAAAREAALHRALRHPHVVRCLGARAHGAAHYVFLEYAQGGELFDRIEPDAGMPERAARRLWRQLLSGVRYLHARGVAHRDLKPENLLLDAHDNLKISDFGMATLFRHGARERLLSRVCGTVPYAAPEVLQAASRPYRAPPADLWAAGVVLVAMLAGELPWERADAADARYAAWAAGGEAGGPWRKVRGAARALLRRLLAPEPARRASLHQLLEHRWLDPGEEVPRRACRSQPAPAPAPASSPSAAPAAPAPLSAADMEALMSYSQPTRAEDLLLAASPDSSQLTQPAVWSRLGARLTRVRVAGSRRAALARAEDALRRAGFHAAAGAARHTLHVECDGDVHMRASCVPEPLAPGQGHGQGEGEGEGDESTLLEFRRWRGCGLLFKRRFRDVQRALAPLAPAPAPGEPMEVA